MQLPYGPTIPLLDIYPDRTIIQKVHSPLCLEKQYVQRPRPRSNLNPSTEEWMKKLRCMYTMEYYSAITQNGIMPFAATWIDLELITLSQKEKDKLYVIPSTWNLKYDTWTYLWNRNRHREQICGCWRLRESRMNLSQADNWTIRNK